MEPLDDVKLDTIDNTDEEELEQDSDKTCRLKDSAFPSFDHTNANISKQTTHFVKKSKGPTQISSKELIIPPLERFSRKDLNVNIAFRQNFYMNENTIEQSVSFSKRNLHNEILRKVSLESIKNGDSQRSLVSNLNQSPPNIY